MALTYMAFIRLALSIANTWIISMNYRKIGFLTHYLSDITRSETSRSKIDVSS